MGRNRQWLKNCLFQDVFGWYNAHVAGNPAAGAGRTVCYSSPQVQVLQEVDFVWRGCRSNGKIHKCTQEDLGQFLPGRRWPQTTGGKAFSPTASQPPASRKHRLAPRCAAPRLARLIAPGAGVPAPVRALRRNTVLRKKGMSPIIRLLPAGRKFPHFLYRPSRPRRAGETPAPQVIRG